MEKEEKNVTKNGTRKLWCATWIQNYHWYSVKRIQFRCMYVCMWSMSVAGIYIKWCQSMCAFQSWKWNNWNRNDTHKGNKKQWGIDLKQFRSFLYPRHSSVFIHPFIGNQRMGIRHRKKERNEISINSVFGFGFDRYMFDSVLDEVFKKQSQRVHYLRLFFLMVFFIYILVGETKSSAKWKHTKERNCNINAKDRSDKRELCKTSCILSESHIHVSCDAIPKKWMWREKNPSKNRRRWEVLTMQLLDKIHCWKCAFGFVFG